MSYSDKEILCLYDENKKSFVRIYETKAVMAEKADKDVKPIIEIACPVDFQLTL